jgi:perosamine synthetase
MRIGRTLPPAAAPIYKYDILEGFKGLLRGQVEIDDFRLELKEYFQVKHCFLLSSGKAALSIILQALKQIFPDRNEVIIPTFTCYSVPSAIVRAGLKVRLCDVNPETLDFNFTELRKITRAENKFLAIVCPHLFGLPANIAKVRGILADPQIAVIEDAAQAMGGVVNNRHIGTIGDIGFFSLGRGKAFSAVAGGIIITNSKKISEKIEHGIHEHGVQSVANNAKLIAYALALSVLTKPSLFWLPKMMPGLKLGETIYDPQFPMKQFSPFQAGMARNWRRRIIVFQAKRKQNVFYWRNVLRRFPWLQPIPIRNESLGETFPLLRFPVLVKTSSLRDALLKVSERCGLGIMITYPGSIDKIEELEFEYKGEVFPGAKECVDRLITFPVHGFVSPKDRLRILRSLDMFQDMRLPEYRLDT